MSKVVDYVSGVCRNEPEARKAHLYAQTAYGKLWPMCADGWNRSDGARFSILRGWTSPKGTCRRCERARTAGRRPVLQGRRKTRWL